VPCKKYADLRKSAGIIMVVIDYSLHKADWTGIVFDDADVIELTFIVPGIEIKGSSAKKRDVKKHDIILL
jgi:hypothetical protein